MTNFLKEGMTSKEMTTSPTWTGTTSPHHYNNYIYHYQQICTTAALLHLGQYGKCQASVYTVTPVTLTPGGLSFQRHGG